MLGHLVSNAAFHVGMDRMPQPAGNLLQRLWALLLRQMR